MRVGGIRVNPYKTLPDLFSNLDRLHLDLSESGLTELNNGGEAMMVYAYLQYTELSEV